MCVYCVCGENGRKKLYLFIFINRNINDNDIIIYYRCNDGAIESNLYISFQ